jgi:putative transposase
VIKLKSECIRPGIPLSLDDARRLLNSYVEHYNSIRLNSAVGYIPPKDMLAGRQQEIHADRDRKLATARLQRQLRRQEAASTEAKLRIIDAGHSHIPIRATGREPVKAFIG